MEKYLLVLLFLVLALLQVEICYAAEFEWDILPKTATRLQERNFVCPQSDGFFEDPAQFCTGVYYACAGGVPYPKECPGGEVFDPEIKRCVPYGEASCNNGQTTSTRTSTISSSTTTTSSTTSRTTSVSTSTTTTAPFVCPEPDGFFPLTPTSCSSSYYICVGGTATLSTCPGNTVFDPQEKKCLTLESSSCYQSFTCPTPEGFYPIPGTCGPDFYVCVSGSPYVSTCPNGNTFDPVTLVCTKPDSATCSGTYQCTAPEGFFPIPDACSNSYYTCVNNEPYITTCPDDGIFDPVLLTCVKKGTESC